MENMTDYDLILAYAKRFGIAIIPELYNKKDKITTAERISSSESLLMIEHIFNGEGKLTTRRAMVMKGGG